MRTGQAGAGRAQGGRDEGGRPADAASGGLRRTALALCLACILASSAGAQEVGVAARVNGAEISVYRLERHFEDYLKLQARNVAAIRNPAVFKRLKREALDQLIDKELLWQEAQRRGVTVDDAAVAAARADIAAGFASPEAFARRIREAGFDEAGYADYLRRELAASRTLQELAGLPDVSDEDVRRTLAEEPAPAGMPADEANRRVRDYLVATRRAEAGRAALERLRTAAQVEMVQRF